MESTENSFIYRCSVLKKVGDKRDEEDEGRGPSCNVMEITEQTGRLLSLVQSSPETRKKKGHAYRLFCRRDAKPRKVIP